MRLLVLLAVTILSACTSSEPESETRPTGQNVLDETTLKSAASGEISFTEHVKPILEAKCAMCHNQSILAPLFPRVTSCHTYETHTRAQYR